MSVEAPVAEGDGEDTAKAPARAASLTAAATTLRDRLVLTWAVPEDRVRPHLPDGVLPDRLPFADGELRAFLQVEYALHQLPYLTRFTGFMGGTLPGFHQVTYRVLTRRTKDGQSFPGTFDLRTFVSVSELHLTKRAVQHQADFARFNVFVDGDPARGTYRLMRVRASGDLGVTQIEARGLDAAPPVPPPFTSFDTLTGFLSNRAEVLFRASLPKNRIGVTPLQMASTVLDRATVPLRYGTLVSARCTPWTDLRLLTAEEIMAPLVVTIEAETTVQALPPRLLKMPA